MRVVKDAALMPLLPLAIIETKGEALIAAIASALAYVMPQDAGNWFTSGTTVLFNPCWIPFKVGKEWR